VKTIIQYTCNVRIIVL